MKRKSIVFVSILTFMLTIFATPVISQAETDAAVKTTVEKAVPYANVGWYYDDYTGAWHYFDENGEEVFGWAYIDGSWYYFDSTYAMYSDVGVIIDGVPYVFTASGRLHTGGWHQTKFGDWLCAKSNGVAYVDWQYFGGYWYYFDANGYMAQGPYHIGEQNNLFYFDQSGHLISDQWIHYIGADDTWHHSLPSGMVDFTVFYSQGVESWLCYDELKHEYKYGWQLFDGNWYYFDSVMGGMLFDRTEEIDGVLYAFNPFGALITNGWYHDQNDDWYYAGSSGALYTSGWYWINGYCYYFNTDGTMAKNDYIDGNYVDPSGAWVYNKWVYSDYAQRYWYRYADGYYPSNTVKNIDGNLYHFDANGYMDVGWIYADGNWYYATSSGALYVDRWAWIDDNCYYFDTDGTMERNVYIDGHYVDSSGKWVENQWIYSTYANRYWYRFADGSYPHDDFAPIDDQLYHFDKNGYMDTGWIYIDGNWYYAASSGALYTSGWYWINGKCYYFSYHGKMASDQIIDGAYVDSSGAWVP